jgi:DNA-directed RNA polymerase subunit M/transcription elongation factor TFIIS
MNHRELVLLTKDEQTAITWLRSSGFIPKTMFCNSCGWKMEIKATKSGEIFKCIKCKNTTSIFSETIFYNSKKNICELLDLIYFWSINMNQGKTRHECNTKSHKTVNIWYEKLNKLSYLIMKEEQRFQKIGGIGHIVEIDESKFSKRKYNVGRAVRSPWVIGGIDIETRDTFFVEVFSRNKEVLTRVILENVEVGTTIYTDEWKGYVDLNRVGYIHFTVNHRRNFIDPVTGANTQLIENSWYIFKKSLRERSITYHCDIPLIFAEFLFKRKYKENTFIVIMRNILGSLNKLEF